MKVQTKKNIERKKRKIDEVFYKDEIPLFSFVELNINETCNRSCKFCPRSDPKIYPNQNLHMGPDVFEELSRQLQEIDFKGIINISGTGEPLMTKHVNDIVRSFGEKDLHIELVTNGDVLTRKNGKETLKNLFQSGLKQIVVSLYDGPDQVDFFDKLFKECDIEKDLYTLRDRWYDEKEEFGLLYTNRAGFIKDYVEKFETSPCYYTHYAIFVDWNGDILLCSQDMYNRTVKFGNIRENNILQIWNDPKMMEFRKKLLTGDRSESPCNKCNANGRIFGQKHAEAWTKKCS